MEDVLRIAWGSAQYATLADPELKLKVCCARVRALATGRSGFLFSVPIWCLPPPQLLASGLLLPESLDAALFLIVTLRCTAGLTFGDDTIRCHSAVGASVSTPGSEESKPFSLSSRRRSRSRRGDPRRSPEPMQGRTRSNSRPPTPTCRCTPCAAASSQPGTALASPGLR
ncbi:unnamed protein product [Ixodes persulcatus]